ncbi:MAG: aldehyde dehydrogenase family protein [Anaerolineae bacterium]|nr:aldehyde dehydrogenase family protein [Anaerolineae bacterium]
MKSQLYPTEVSNWINGQEVPAISGELFDKLNPANGQRLSRVARSHAEDVQQAVTAARQAQPAWADTPAVQRGMLLHKLVVGLQARQEEIARIVALETGKSYKDAYGETGGAIALGLFYASEGQRLYGRTTTSGTANKYAMTVRQPIGVAGLIIAANTPIANVAWKIFPAMICGNTAILKAAEDTPATAWIVGQIAQEVGLPPGVLNIIQGYGEEAGAPLVEHPDVGVISFTGSTEVGRLIQRAAGARLARVSLELGGKNPLVVCDDADLDNAAKWVLLSAFSNAGQRCASGSRIIIFDSIYEKFREMLVERTQMLKLGPTDDDDLGPVINEGQLNNMLASVEQAQQQGATVLVGGTRLTDPEHRAGFYMAPTLIENVDPQAEISACELFGPIAILYRVKDFDEALRLANDSPYGLTACIHTRSIHRAVRFCDKVQAGVAVVNAGTYGSEPHMPFGGLKQSGNGSREPGTEALDIYSELKDIYINIDPSQL